MVFEVGSMIKMIERGVEFEAACANFSNQPDWPG